jgi:hypothetical protein
MEVLGKVHLLGVEINVTASYAKRELVVKTDEQYPQFISIEFGQGKCNEYLDKLKIGDEVKIGINLGGREWTNPQGEVKHFNSIKGWKVEKIADASTPAPETVPIAEFALAPKQPEGQVQDPTDDLPFN